MSSNFERLQKNINQTCAKNFSFLFHVEPRNLPRWSGPFDWSSSADAKDKILLYLALLYFNWWIKQNWINSYLGFAIRGILRNFATKNIAKGREGIVHGLIVNGLVEIFDKNISNTRSTKARITLAPHNTDWTAFQNVKIHCIQSSFGCNLIGFH